MARISSYTKDTSVEKTDKFLGSNFGGATKNFTVSDISNFFKTTNAAGVAAQFVWQYDAIITSPTTGKMVSTFSSGVTFANLQSLVVSKYIFGEVTNSIENILATLANQDIIIVDTANQNNFGVYTIDTIAVVGGTDNYTITLVDKTSGSETSIHSNGSFVADNYYSIMIFGGTGRTYTHHQNNSDTTWTINHNLGKFPSVSLKFSSSDNIYTNVGAFAGVTYTDANTITITLAAAESGYAYLN